MRGNKLKQRIKDMKEEILEGKDLRRYSEYTSPKAMRAREVAKRIEYFLPYFMGGESEESNILGWLFGNEVIDNVQNIKISANEKLEQIEKEINSLQIETQKQTGSFKYDECYEECLQVINKYKV